MSRSDLSKGPEELLEHRASRINWSVLLISSLVIIAFSIWAVVVPDDARTTMKSTVDWIATSLGWYYVVTMTLVIGFVIWVGIDMLFYSVTGPVVQYLYPPSGEGGTSAAMQDAVVWTMFHYGIAGWAMYSLLGMAMGYFAYRWGMPLSIRAALYALLGKRVRGPLGDGISIVSLFGNSALYQVLQGNTAFAELAIQSPEQGWYALLQMFPGPMFLVGLATLSGLLFYLTSANSGAMVMSNFSASIPDPSQEGPKWLCIFWAVLTAVLTVAMLLAGGVTTMEYATLIFALPVTIIAYLTMASFYKVLRMERAEREGQVLRRPSVAPIGGQVPERSWKQRLEQLRSYPSLRQVTQFLDRTVRPALDDLTAEFKAQGYEVQRSTMTNAYGVEEPVLRISMDTFRAFHYQVAIVEAPVPMFSGRMSRETDVYYRLEVFTQTGSGGYDLMGLTKQQVIDDVLERYEAHLAFLTFSTETATASVLTPSILPRNEPSAVPTDPGDIHDLGGSKE